MLSVIICTSPGREANLDAALACLFYQRLLPTEVIVVDDGSLRGEAVVHHHQRQHKIPIHYLWRVNDCCVARSRNLGTARAQQRLLVFIDADMLLNDRALAAYWAYLQDFPEHAIYGYFGYQLNYLAPSYLVQGRTVLWCDRRFTHYAPERLVPTSNMLRYPHEWAWSGNFALHRETYERINGFNTAFKGWGGEDLDFAWRLRQQGTPIHFFLDAWAEQQVHTREERFHQFPAEEKRVTYAHHYVSPEDYTPEVRFTEEAGQELRRVIFDHYIPHGHMLATDDFSSEMAFVDDSEA